MPLRSFSYGIKYLYHGNNRDYRTLTALSLGLRPRESGQLSMIIPPNHGITITCISREISIEHPSVGLASLAQANYTPYITRTEHAYCLSYCFFNKVVITTVIEMVEMVEILDGRLGKHSVERVRYVINNLLHLVIVKYGAISLYFAFPLVFGS